jgi:hypothetical protein
MANGTVCQFFGLYVSRGAAYGLAGFVKGLGISALKKFNIMTTLQEAVEDKKHANARQGALFAFECLCNMLERLFEPYVIQVSLPCAAH